MSTGTQQPDDRTPPAVKPVFWLGGEIKTPPVGVAARHEAGWLLRRLQEGQTLGLPHSRPMPSVGKACHELRINDEKTSWRVFYRIDPDAILVLDVAEKRTQKTPKQVIDQCQARLAKYDQERRERR
jgi:phage-related protein